MERLPKLGCQAEGRRPHEADAQQSWGGLPCCQAVRHGRLNSHSAITPRVIGGIFRFPRRFKETATEAPDRIVVIEGDARTTLAGLWNDSGRLAAHFHRIGLRRGDRVVFQLPSSIAFFSTFLALLRIGTIPVMALPPHRETELIHFARFSEATALFVPQRIGDFDFRPMAEAVRMSAPTVRHIFVQGDAMEGQVYRCKGLQPRRPSRAI